MVDFFYFSLSYFTHSNILPELDWFAEYKKERAEREALHRFKEDISKKAKREARIKKMKEEHGSTRWRTKRKVEIYAILLTSLSLSLSPSLSLSLTHKLFVVMVL